MSLAVFEDARGGSNPQLIRIVTRGSIGLAAALGGFVIREPAPYELYLVALMGIFVALGMNLPRQAVTLTALFVAFNVGGLLSMFQLADLYDTPIYLAVSLFLGLSSVFFCAAIANDAARLRTINRGYIIGAVVTSLFGCLGYFGAIPGAENFVRYDRAKGLFEDPNVFGPFLVMPALYLGYGLLYRSHSMALVRGTLLLILVAGIFLSFSRAAWGLLVIGGGLLYVLLFLSESSERARANLIAMGAAALVAAMMAIVLLLQFDMVSDMFEQRAQVVQEYDGARVGRFARHAIGFEWALSAPLGIGPLEFGRRLGEDTHNIWVKALMAYGWLGFAAYLTLTVMTIVGGARLLLRDRAWRPYLQVAWSAYIGHIVIAWVIDIDHWRHVHLIIGVIWGCMALEYKRGRALTSGERTAA